MGFDVDYSDRRLAESSAGQAANAEESPAVELRVELRAVLLCMLRYAALRCAAVPAYVNH